MEILVVNQSEIPALLPMRECIDEMARALQSLSSGKAILPLRNIIRLPDGQNAFAVMPTYMAAPESMGAKLVTVFPDNHGTSRDSHQGAVLLFETTHGSLQAIMDASSITGIRTAAVSGVATRALAREDATTLAIIGTGVQARTHLESMLHVRSIGRVSAWSRNPDNVRSFAAWAQSAHGCRVHAARTAREAVDGAHIVCIATSSREPVVLGDWIAPGTHINAVGSSSPAAREVDTRLLVKSRFFVDRRESTVNEAGDFLIPRNEGAVDDDHIQGEIGEVLLGAKPGRRSPDDITLFKSLGLAIEDVASAHLIYRRAMRSGAGVKVELGGERDAAH